MSTNTKTDGSFAKVFGKGKKQLVVIQQTNDQDKPEVRVFFKPADLGVCSFALGFNNSDAGWELCDALFAKLDDALDEKDGSHST